MTPGPGLRKWAEYLSPGPGGMPLALRLSDWLGLARLHGPTRRCSSSCPAGWTSRSALPAVAWQDFKPPCLSSCRRSQCRPRRPNELANDHRCLRSAVLRFGTLAPSNFLRASSHCRSGRDLPSAHAVPGPPEHPARTDRAVCGGSARRPLSGVQFAPTRANYTGTWHGGICEA